MRGPSRLVQVALGWSPIDRAERIKDQVAPCSLCGSALRFDVQDPQLMGRSMEQCTNEHCYGSSPHVMRVVA